MYVAYSIVWNIDPDSKKSLKTKNSLKQLCQLQHKIFARVTL